MRTLLLLFTLFLSTLCKADFTLNDLYSEDKFSYLGYITALAYVTDNNNFIKNRKNNNDTDSENGIILGQAGFLFTYKERDWLTFRYYATTEDWLDFAFVDMAIINEGRYGIRAGRVNRLSGFFTGFGPHTDQMNFLPQGTALERLSDVFFRFDGIQLYGNYQYKNALSISIDATIGKQDIETQTDLFDPTFFSIFDKEGFHVEAEELSRLLSVRLEYYSWQVFADYVNSELSFDATFAGVYPVHIPRYDISTLKLGLGKSFDTSEVLLTFFEQTGRMPHTSHFSLGGVSLGNRFKPMGASILWRGYTEQMDILYTGYSYYRLDLNQENLASVGIDLPKHTDYQHNIFVGYSKRCTQNIHSTIEVHRNIGAATLSATYQDLADSKKHWWVYSLSVSYLF